MILQAWLLAAALLPQQPVPQPFPKPGTVQPARPAQPPPAEPAKPAPNTPPSSPPPTTAKPPAAAEAAAPTEAMLGVPIYPAAQFLASYDAGRGQRYYIFGSGA